MYIGRVLAVWGILAAISLVVVMTALAEPFDPQGFGPGQDARAYWAAPGDDPYTPDSVGAEGAYLYSPAFLVSVSPLKVLPWPVFVAAWTVILLLVLFWLSRPILFFPMILLTLPELWGGNITILLAAAVVLGFSRPSAWAFALLTKVTPGIGLLWFGVRREWPALGFALATTLVVIALTAAFTPGLWGDWVVFLEGSTDSSTVPGSVPVPLLLRLPLAAAIICFAALTGRRWLLPVGVLLAMPVIWWGSLSILVASVALRRDDIEAWILRTAQAVEDRLTGVTHPAPRPRSERLPT